MRRVFLYAAVVAASLAVWAEAAGTTGGRDDRPLPRPTVTDDGTPRPAGPRGSGGGGSRPDTSTAAEGFEPTKPPPVPPPGQTELQIADHRRPGSLLLFPEFDNRDGIKTILTVTNTDALSGQNVNVEFKYIDKTDCSEFNRTETLTPNDTVSLITTFHNPQNEQGYVYAFAKDSGGAIVWNALIGHQLMIDGVLTFDYGVNPISFVGVGDDDGDVQPNGTHTDLDGDNNRDLDGREYAQAPAELLVPRFLGQSYQEPDGAYAVSSQLVLIALSGGSRFSTRVDFLIYNDNEEVFSSEYEFSCWAKPHLLQISNIFSNSFLAQFTNDDPGEVFGEPDLESGWFRMDGGVANSTAESIQDPAVYCVLVEHMNWYGAADLPFSVGGQDNGSLVPRHIFGDGDPTAVDGDDQ